MKRQILMLIVLAALPVLLSGTPSAAGGNAQDTCTLNTIKGTYLSQAHGVVLSDGEARVYVEAGTWTLDGKGNATGVFSASIGGVPIATQEAFTAPIARTQAVCLRPWRRSGMRSSPSISTRPPRAEP